MFLKRHLDAFTIYIFLLIISTSVLINGVPEYNFINFITYLFVHILLIYLSVYYFKLSIYFVFFIIGIILDIFLLNEFGPHLLTFMLLIFLIKKLHKFMNTLTSHNIFFLMTFILIASLIFEMVLCLMFFNYSFNTSVFLKNTVFGLLIPYPIFYLFNKIDKFG